jgi:hypothetical protein
MMAKHKQKCDEYGVMVCPVCGSRFIYNPQSIYKIKQGDKTIHLCKYTCFREAGGGLDRVKRSIVK